MDASAISELKALFATDPETVLITHKSPDGDAVGSSLGMYHFLRQTGMTRLNVIVPDPYPAFLEWLPGQETIVVASEAAGRAEALLQQARVIICLDFNALHRIDSWGEVIATREDATKVLIDHHPNPESFANYAWSDTSASSTAELVYRFIEAWDGLSLVSKEVAQCVYTGILTDTGSFRFNSTGAKTHRIAAHLLERGVSVDEVYGHIYENNRFSRLQLWGYVLSEKLEYLPEFQVSYLSLSQKELQSFDYRKGDTEGLVNQGLSIEGVRMTAFFRESEQGYVKISFRSKGDFDVNQFARAHFSGGGHRNAAGGRCDLPLDQCLRNFESILKTYAEELRPA